MTRSAFRLVPLLLAMAIGSACDKETPSVEPADNAGAASAGLDEKSKTAEAKTDHKPGLAGAKILPAEKKKAAAPSVPGLKTFESKEHKFSVTTATLSPQIGPVTEKAPGITISGKSFMFPFKDRDSGLGGISSMTAVTKLEYDVEKGLDGAVEQAVAGMGAKLLSHTKKPDNGRPARQFTFSGQNQGIKFDGSGRAIGVGPKRMTIAFVLSVAGSRAGAAEAKVFIESFQAE